jgi:hypothetical protein
VHLLLLHPHPTPALKDEGFSSLFSRFWTVTPAAVLTIKAIIHQHCWQSTVKAHTFDS